MAGVGGVGLAAAVVEAEAKELTARTHAVLDTMPPPPIKRERACPICAGEGAILRRAVYYRKDGEVIEYLPGIQSLGLIVCPSCNGRRR